MCRILFSSVTKSLVHFLFLFLCRGVCNSVTGLASNFARNLHDLSLDAEHIRRTAETRQQWQPQSLAQGLAYGLNEFGLSLLGGFAGVAHHPLQALIESSPSTPGQDNSISSSYSPLYSPSKCLSPSLTFIFQLS